MTLGRKRNRVSLLKRSVAVNAGGEHVEQFQTLGTAWTEIQPRTAREVNGTVMVEEGTFDFHFMYDPGGYVQTLTGADQISFRGDIYEVTGPPMNLGGRDRELRVPTRLVTPSGVGNG